MSLSGNLSFVPIDEVLRLLTRAKQQGSVEVTGNGIHGRVFIGERGVDLATTFDDEDLHRHLVNSGFADENSLRRITTGETTLAALADSNKPLIELLREMSVESIYQIGTHGDEFEVYEGVTTPYASPNSFELEKLLSDAREREKEWGKVTEVVPDLTGAISFRRDLGEREEVTVKTDDWKVLSEIGIGASVSEIAESLGTTNFWAARVTSRLVKSELVDIEAGHDIPAIDDANEDGTAEQATPEWHDESSDPAITELVAEDVDDVVDHEQDVSAEEDSSPIEAEATVEAEMTTEVEEETVVVADKDPNESWWQEPEDEVGSTDESDDIEPAVVSEGLSEMPPVSTDGDSDVEEDTEAFLEKVFSELESSPDSEAEEGHGLLRRRRMGTLRDFSSDS